MEEEKEILKELEIMKEVTESITKEQSKILLKKCGIMNPVTPHHYPRQK